MPLKNKARLDAAENVFFQRQLEMIEPRFYEKKYALRKARSFVPTGELIPDGIEVVTYRTMEKLGKAKRIANAADDLPSVNLMGTESSSTLWDYGSSYQYTLAEIKAAARASGGPALSIDAQRADAAREVLAQTLDELIAVGDSDIGTKGILNLSGTNDVTSGLTGGWVVGSPATVLEDVFGLIDENAKQTLDVETTKRVIMPTNLHRFLSSTPRSATSDTTLLKYIQDNRPGVEIATWERANGAGSSGKDRMIAYTPDPTLVRHLMSVELEQLPPQQRNFKFTINLRMRAGGVIAYYPKSICYGDVALG